MASVKGKDFLLIFLSLFLIIPKIVSSSGPIMAENMLDGLNETVLDGTEAIKPGIPLIVKLMVITIFLGGFYAVFAKYLGGRIFR